MPSDVAPHATELWTAKIARSDADPHTARDGEFDTVLAPLLHPTPVEIGPVFVIDNAPALGGDERPRESPRDAHLLVDLTAQRGQPVVRASAVDTEGVLLQREVAVMLMQRKVVADLLKELVVIGGSHPKVRL